MNRVSIDGSPQIVRTAMSRSDVIPIEGKDLDDGRVRIFAYVSTSAIAAVEALGATVELLQTETERLATLDELYALIEEDEPPVA
jgi:hypothetical protein